MLENVKGYFLIAVGLFFLFMVVFDPFAESQSGKEVSGWITLVLLSVSLLFVLQKTWKFFVSRRQSRSSGGAGHGN